MQIFAQPLTTSGEELDDLDHDLPVRGVQARFYGPSWVLFTIRLPVAARGASRRG